MSALRSCLFLAWIGAFTFFGCSGAAVVEGPGGGGGGAGGWSPCGGKACGEGCTPCDPASPDCVLPGTPLHCDAAGACVAGPPSCADTCTRDEQCLFGAEWCIGGVCAPCDNSGQVCDLGCPFDWRSYARNGCTPCACAPPNDCTSDAECGAAGHCYAGGFCWCEPADPTCCQGNVCGAAGCAEPPPSGCVERGCPEGDTCDLIDCAPSSCTCDGGGWACTEDCGGGVCVTPL